MQLLLTGTTTLSCLFFLADNARALFIGHLSLFTKIRAGSHRWRSKNNVVSWQSHDDAGVDDAELWTARPLRPPSHLEGASTAEDWKRYALWREYERTGGVLYKRAALSPDEFSAIVHGLRRDAIEMAKEEGSSFATNRIGARIEQGSEIHRILSREDGSLSRLVNCLTAMKGGIEGMGTMILSPDIPTEIRVYEKSGACMEWHVDDVLYWPEQVEVVLTIDNTSDCFTMWRPHDLPSPEIDDKSEPKYEVRSVQTTPNSVLVLKAGGVEHKVSPLSVGRRTILKMAFVREGAVMVEGMEGHASHHLGRKKREKGRGGGGKKAPKRKR